jgi:hypothetical protein
MQLLHTQAAGLDCSGTPWQTDLVSRTRPGTIGAPCGPWARALTLGVWVGAIAGGLMSWTLAIERSPLSMLLSAVECGMVGLLCGLLLWLGSADFPEETICPYS